jgi:thiamine biosynthesis lipoprotein
MALAGALAALALITRVANAQPERYEFSELHMGMRVRMVLYAPNDSVARRAAREAYERVAELEDILSDYRPSSEVRRLSAVSRGRRVAIGRDLCTVLGRALELARRSDGAFDPTMGAYVALWREARRTHALPTREALASAAQRSGWRKVRLDGPRCRVGFDVGGMQLDLGGIAKGYILDQGLAALKRRGVTRAMLEAGGDIVVGDAPPGGLGWTIAVPHADSALVARANALVRGAVATSGDTEQSVTIDGTRYAHIIDPRTGLGITSRALATVVAPDGMTADGLATALTVLAPEVAGLLERYPRAYAVVRRVRDGAASSGTR